MVVVESLGYGMAVADMSAQVNYLKGAIATMDKECFNLKNLIVGVLHFSELAVSSLLLFSTLITHHPFSNSETPSN